MDFLGVMALVIFFAWVVDEIVRKIKEGRQHDKSR
jgi:flagellar biogenesis protein FliO